MKRGRSAVVAVVRCESYEPREVREAVHAALSHLGGMSRFVRSGQSVLLKPNLLSARDPEKAVTTHPAILEALIGEAKRTGGSIGVGDSPGGAVRGVERVWRNTGMADLAERTGVPLINFEASGAVPMRGRFRTYHIAKPVLDADVVINVPKMKTHVLTLYTGCVKNMFGSIPGFGKARIHNMAPRPVPFSRHMVDVYSLVQAQLHVMDAVVAMEGDGPSSGKPRRVGAILAGSDPVAVDAVACSMMGFGDGQVPTVRIADSWGLGTGHLREIEIRGEDPQSFDLAGFIQPSTRVFNFLPTFLIQSLRPFVWVHPEMSPEWGCRGEACELCIRSCPVKAITMIQGRPVVDYRRCVECLCCHEVCPEQAVHVNLSWLARRLA